MTPEDAVSRVRAYLAAMERRDLPTAQALLAPGFEMTFPTGARFTSLADLVAWSRPRYRSVTKSFRRADAAISSDGIAVTVFGTLAGEWPDGTPFSGVRYCDWFLVTDAGLARQEVWNDLAAAR